MSHMICAFNMGWGGLCQQVAIPGEQYCESHLGLRCVSCGSQAVKYCGGSVLGHFSCEQLICEACTNLDNRGCCLGHADRHHDEEEDNQE